MMQRSNTSRWLVPTLLIGVGVLHLLLALICARVFTSTHLTADFC